jgi:hypothetical protein
MESLRPGLRLAKFPRAFFRTANTQAFAVTDLEKGPERPS